MNSYNPRQDHQELHAIIWGRVQGVGFRVAARQYAIQLDLKGTARNLEDGNVEIFIQGPKEKLEEFIKLLKEHFGPGYIARFDIKYQNSTQMFDQFSII